MAERDEGTRPEEASCHEPDQLGPVPEDTRVGGTRRLNPTTLGYLIGPIAFLTILVLMHFNFIVHGSAWTWLGIFIAVPVSNLLIDRAYATRPSPPTFHLRVAIQVASVSGLIYLTGRGPVLWGAYAFVALTLMGAFVLFFVIRMAGATMEQKEESDAAVRRSEDRFRSLLRNTSDVTIIIGEEGIYRFLSPAAVALLGYEQHELVGTRATDYVHPDD
jgi:PAS domain-containing protein